MIDVVVPVYGGVGQTRRCLESVLACTASGIAEVIVVDDATPEPAIAEYIDGLVAAGRVTLLRNASNLGFVQSVNRGMALHADRDVVLLNSDTEVAPGWLERLSAAACRDPAVATATPFSNNGTLCSYPYWGWTGGTPGSLGLARLDTTVARANAGRAIDIPTGVGFCMYVRRDALADLGLFDARRYGRGYGEENDFCMRALKAGRRNVLAADVFVYHEGGISFAEETASLTEANTLALLEAHPDYHERVHAFMATDPAAPLRLAIDLARIAEDGAEARHVLNERHAEQTRWRTQARELESWSKHLQADNATLQAALSEARADFAHESRAHAQAVAEIARLNEEIGKLRHGLAYAEGLAFAREKELADIRSLPLWRYYHYLMRRAAKTHA